MVEKLAKALDGLKSMQFPTSMEEINMSKKKKMFFCVLAADVMVSVKPVNLQNLPIVIENMINLCDDKDSDVRMIADESLNRIIMSISEWNMPKVQIELHEIIKKNGPARCLRAALTRFSQLSQYIRPSKGKIHAQKIVPCLIEISKREEESIHETLALSFENIFKVLGVFIQDNSLKELIKAFLNNLSSNNPVIRRCSATCITKLVQYCRKPHIFNTFVLNSLLDCVIPVLETNSKDLVLGVLGCIRMLLPNLISVRYDERISGSFGLRRKQDESFFSVDRLIQIYELCLHYTKSNDHNMVAASLETLNQILQNTPSQLETVFLSPTGISRSYIYSGKENKLLSRSGSETSVAFSLPPADECLLDDSDISAQLFNFSTKNQFGSKPSASKINDKFSFEDDGKVIENPFREKFMGKLFGSQNTLDNDSDTESSVVSELNTPPLLLMEEETEEKSQNIKEEEEDEDRFISLSKANSQENLDSFPTANEAFPEVLTTVNIGSFTDASVPLIYCARHLAASFLLDSSPNCLKSDKIVRVSIKSLALNCISAIIKLFPAVLKMNLSKNKIDLDTQEMSDILLFSDHCDPQIRGCVYVLIGSFIHSTLLESKGFFSDLLSEDTSKLSIKNLTDIILKGLKDKSSICVRQALSGVKICINTALVTPYNKYFLAILHYLPTMIENSYWLVKVKLVEIFAVLPYVIVNDLTKTNSFQSEAIDFVLFPFHGDEDARVRLAAAESLVSVVSMLCDNNAPELEYAKTFVSSFNQCSKAQFNFSDRYASPCIPFSYALLDSKERNYSKKIEDSVSIIVSKLSDSLMVSENKYFLFGYIEALKLLSEKYPTTIYSKGWNCSKFTSEIPETDFLASDLVTIVYSLMVTSPDFLDLTALSNATVLLGNLFAGHCLSNLKSNYHVSINFETNECEKLWNVFCSERLSQLAEEIFTHLLKMLNIYSHLVEETSTSSMVKSNIAANAFLPLLSPIKKQEKKNVIKTEDKKVKNSNGVKQTIQYVKLQQILKNAYTSYKISLDKSVGDKFLNLLESTLYTFSILLEVSTVRETGRCAEEILSYLQSVVSLKPNPTIICVNQLLKSFFGINLISSWEGKKILPLSYEGYNLFDTFFQLPTKCLSEKIYRRVNQNSLECQNLIQSRRKTERKIIIKNTDKSCLATYIKLLEPMVITSFQLYTITGNVELQSNILHLLSQLIQLGVNYCLLDPNQVFVGFVLKQFELIERGQIPKVEVLLPHIFKFFILLSYGKQHSKSIISIPKIFQLCDGLMASDQPVQTHSIPALIPVVEEIFLFRNVAQDKELETQRDVLLAMMLRLAEFPQVMDMLTIVLNATKTLDEKEKWKRWSRQVVDEMLPLASQNRLLIESFEGRNSFVNLMSSLSPNVLRPIDPLLKVLFVEPVDYNCSTSLKRWFSKVTVFLETILFVKEDVLLNRLEEISPNINLNVLTPGETNTLDPFNIDSFFQVYEPSETVARFILKVIFVASSKILETISSSESLQWKLSTFFICLYHVLKSGTFHRITNSLQNLLAKEQDSWRIIFLPFKKLVYFCPFLSTQFSYFLTLLNCCCGSYWNEILSAPATLSAKLVQWCGVLALSDYLCDNPRDTETLHYLLLNNMQEIVILSREIPVKELLMTIRKRKFDWTALLKIISSENYEKFEPDFVEKLLRILEVTDDVHSGQLLVLLINKYLFSSRLALSLLAGAIACRQVEFLLTLPKEKVVEEIDEKTFYDLISFFSNKSYLRRHFNLWNLLKRLSYQVFNSAHEIIDSTETEGEIELKNIKLQKDWYFSQVKQRCSQKSISGPEMASLLGKLCFEDIMKILSHSEFNVKILKDCLVYQQIQRLKCEDLNDGNFDSLNEALKCFLLSTIKTINLDVRNIKKEIKTDWNSPVFIDKIKLEKNLYNRIWDILPSLNAFLENLHQEDIDLEHLVEIKDFGILSFEVIGWTLRQKEKIYPEISQNDLENALLCCSAALKNQKIKASHWEASNHENLKFCINHLYYILKYLMYRFGRPLHFPSEEILSMVCDYEALRLLLKFVTVKSTEALLPIYLINCMRDLIISICRIPEFNIHVLKVPENCDMQEIESLEKFIWRFTVIGWSNKQQFEEIWVALLAVLGFNTQGDIPLEETKFIVQASVVAVEGITTLLKNTLLDSKRKQLIHHGRDFLAMKNLYQKLPLLGSSNENNQFFNRSYHFLDNLEILKRDDRYVHGLLSVEYLWTAVKQITSHIELYEKHTEELSLMGLDLPSCIYLLTELYSQWINQTSPDIKIITSSLKSSIVISELFTDISQFQWLLNFCLKIDELVTEEDIVILPLIIFGSSKAGAITLPDVEGCEKIKKIMLKSDSVPCRIAAVQGLLYLLQSYTVCYAVNHRSLPPPGSNFLRDEANFVANIVDTFVPVALEMVQQFKFQTESITEEYDRCHWSLIFYLLQNYPSSLGDLKEELMGFIVSTLRSKTCSDSLMNLLIRGVERLLLTTVIDDHFKDQVSKVCLEIITNDFGTRCLHGLQLLMVLSFLDKRVKDIRQLVTGQEDPERIMKDMEKINALFEKLKKSYPKEAEMVGEVLSYILMDFSASDVLTKVIHEFLSPQQPHQKILAGLLFKVFERAELQLIEDWVVFSLPNLIQRMPVSESIWVLNCFFVCASSEPWLRSLFPLVQSRMRTTEHEDKKLLCLSGAHFFKQLKHPGQKEAFIQALEKASKTDSVLKELLSALL